MLRRRTRVIITELTNHVPVVRDLASNYPNEYTWQEKNGVVLSLKPRKTKIQDYVKYEFLRGWLQAKTETFRLPEGTGEG